MTKREVQLIISTVRGMASSIDSLVPTDTGVEKPDVEAAPIKQDALFNERFSKVAKNGRATGINKVGDMSKQLGFTESRQFPSEFNIEGRRNRGDVLNALCRLT